MKSLIRIAFTILALGYGALAFAQAFVMEIRGTATVQTGTAAAVPLVAGEKLSPGAVLQTGPSSSVVLGFPDKQICVIGEMSAFRVIDYRYEPGQAEKGQVSLNLINGSLRIAVGDIGAANPGAIRVQIGVATMGLLPSGDARADASVVVLGGPVSVVVQEGRAVILTPAGQPQEIAAGQGMYLGADGAVRRGDASQMADVIGQSSEGKEILKLLAALQDSTQTIKQTVIVLAALIGSEPTADILSAPATTTTTTAGTAGTGGGGNIASPN